MSLRGVSTRQSGANPAIRCNLLFFKEKNKRISSAIGASKTIPRDYSSFNTKLETLNLKQKKTI